MSETACTEPMHTNGNPAAITNVGAGKLEDPRNEGDRATSHYVCHSGISKRQAVKAPSHITTVSIPRREEQSSGTHVSRLAGQKNRYPATHSTYEEENDEIKTNM